jgi:hypothetical protein
VTNVTYEDRTDATTPTGELTEWAAEHANEVKAAINSKADQTDLDELQVAVDAISDDLSEVLTEAITDIIETGGEALDEFGSALAEAQSHADSASKLLMFESYATLTPEERSEVLGLFLAGPEFNGPMNPGEVAYIDETGLLTGLWSDLFEEGMSVRQEMGDAIASAGTITIGYSGTYHVTGTTTITDIDFTGDHAGREVRLIFDGALTLTHHATTLILPTAANITTAAGDSCIVVSEGSDAVRVTAYQRKSGAALLGGVSDGDKGDITVSSSGAAWAIDNDVVTYAKMQNVSAQYRILGRSTSGAGDVEELTTSANMVSLLASADYSTARTNLGLAIGTNVQAFDADLTSLATNWVQASASGASSLDFHEDTDNGSNRVRLIGPASTADVTVTLPAATGTVALLESPSFTTPTLGVATATSINGMAFTAASGSGGSSIKFLEDTDGGSNGTTLQGPDSTADVTVKLPAVAGTLLTGAAAEGAAPTFNTIELGTSQTDTTLSRSAAGILAVEGVPVKLAGIEEIWVDATEMTAAITSGAEPVLVEMATNDQMVQGFAFDTSADEFVHFKKVFQKSWNNSTILFRPVWYHTTSNATATVTWCFEAVATSNDDTMDVAWGTAQRVVDDGATGLDNYTGANSSALTIGGTPATGDLIFFRVSRDVDGNGTAGNDDLAQDAILLGVVLTITTNAATDA